MDIRTLEIRNLLFGQTSCPPSPVLTPQQRRKLIWVIQKKNESDQIFLGV